MKLISTLLYGAVVALLSAACYQPPVTVPEHHLHGAVQIPEPPSLTLRGHLDYRPIPPKKNYKNFNGIDFFLVNETAQSYNLAPSGTVSFDKLVQFDDLLVEIQAVKKTPEAPAQGTAYPIDDFGNPLKTSERYEVVSIRGLKP